MAAPSIVPASIVSNTQTATKPIHCLIVDTGPLIANQPNVSTLLAQAHQIYTIPSVVSEIKDEETRTRIQTQLLPFVKLRSPKPESIKFVVDFARKTGDLEVLSKPDLHLLALCYELCLEQNGGEGLRKEPVRAAVVKKVEETKGAVAPAAEEIAPANESVRQDEAQTQASEASSEPARSERTDPSKTDAAADELGKLALEDAAHVPSQAMPEVAGPSAVQAPSNDTPEAADSDDDLSDGWITPSNLKQQQRKDDLAAAPGTNPLEPIDAAILTNDFAMQNVALRIGLELVSSSTLMRINKLKTWILRCHGCFATTRQMSKQFCPRCGQPTLTRVSCSTDSKGAVHLHLKKNYTYNKRGNVFSIPKPTHGTANGKLAPNQGGGKQGWGRELILAEDQKEYTRKADEARRTRAKDIMDEDYLPNILTGERTGGHGRIKVGAGRSVNSKKRR